MCKLSSSSVLIRAVAIALLTATPMIVALAQEGKSDSLLAAYVAESWRSHPNIGNMHAMIAAENSRTSMSKSWMNPELRAGLMNVPESFDVHADPMTMLQIGVMQQIPFPGKLKASGNAGEARTSAAKATLEQERYRMADMVAMSYYDLAAALEIRQTLDQGLLLTNQSVEAATALLSTGVGTQSEVLRASLEYEEWNLKLLENASAIERKRAALAYAVGRSDANTLQDPIVPDSLPPILDLNTGLTEIMKESAPQIRTAGELARAAEFDLQRAKLDYWPDLRLMLAYGLRGNLNGDGLYPHTGETIPQSFKQDNMVTIEVSAPVPLFSRGNQQAKIREARAMNLSRQSELSESVLNLQRELRIIHAELTEKMDQYEVNKRLLHQAEAAWRSTLVDYQAGKSPFMSLSESRTNLVMIQIETVMLHAEAWAAYSKWQNTLGIYSINAQEQ